MEGRILNVFIPKSNKSVNANVTVYKEFVKIRRKNFQFFLKLLDLADMLEEKNCGTNQTEVFMVCYMMIIRIFYTMNIETIIICGYLRYEQ